MQRAALVYQAGIANVFTVADFLPGDPGRRLARRVCQSSFDYCKAFARGMRAAGYEVRVYACNRAGDIASSVWSDDLDDAPFSEHFARTI